jgi:alpha-1,2-mannosyltransferase
MNKEQNPALFRIRCAMTIVFAVAVGLWLCGANETHSPVESFFTLTQYNDSWYPMEKAVNYLKNDFPGKKLLYSQLYFKNEIRFLYPPTSLIVPYALSYVVPDVPQVMRGMTFFFILGLIFFLIKIFLELYDSRKDWLPVTGACFIITMFFYPAMWGYHMGQMQVWINTAFAALIYFYIKGKPGIAGIFGALMCAVKPHYALLLIWGLVRGKKEFALYFAGTTAVVLGISIALFGFANHLDYLGVLNDISRHGGVFFSNQSVNGFLNRLFLNGDSDSLAHMDHDYLPFHPLVYAGTLGAAVLFTAAALLIGHRSPKKGGAIDLCVIAISLTVTSPTAWDHYYGILLPMYFLVFPLFWKIRGNPYFLPLVLSYFLCSQSFPGLNFMGNVPGWNVLISYRFFGALIFLGVLYGLLFRKEEKTA